MIRRFPKLDTHRGSLLRQMLVFALPIMAMNVLQLLFNAADMIVVGRYSGSQALAAVGATGSLINLIVNLFMGLSVGASVIVAQDFGAEKPDEISRSVHTSITVSAINGVLVMVLGLSLVTLCLSSWVLQKMSSTYRLYISGFISSAYPPAWYTISVLLYPGHRR